ncbi:MAG: acetyl-CoA C-acetyltransferase [Candidatus Thermoplasmatota archaeon]|jgi:acetyl-CoA C-acetyltransferase|nr:acetyl-CoA C-acetyltransferase [Candidatus Thermoplasmatota archaeon]MCK5300263.1 acetyl-CoA C-acetyltransferase [Thermoplasmatales archaeon]
MKEVVIVSGVRTAHGRFSGALKGFSAPQLGGIAIKEAVKKAGLKPSDVEEVIMGNVVQAGLGQNVARQAAINAGIPYEAGAFHVDKVCGSSLKAVVLAAQAIKCNDAECIVAGGMESMTNCPYVLDKARFGYRMFDGKIIDTMVHDGLWDVYNNFHMGNTGEIIAERNNITRKDCDEFAAKSQIKAAKATKNGSFKDEVIQIEIKQKKSDPIIFDKDEGIREDTTVEKLSKLKPFFKENGVVTAGNASQITDGSSAIVVMSKEKAEKKGIKPIVTIKDYNTWGVKPEHVMEAPIPGVKKLLKKMNLTIDDIDIVEHNEAFSSASIALMKSIGIPEDIFNIHGGAVAIGHPIGSSGSRILVTLIHAMKKYNKNRGLATICLGGGNAVSMIIER